MKKLLKFFLRFSFPALIILVSLVLFYTNYQPGTYLSGWDSLHPEFNLALYLKRAFWGVWQEHQGVGAVASQAHPAELSRLLFVWLLNLVLPTGAVRYSFFFITLAVGGLGVYWLSKYLLSISTERYSQEASFMAATFYILNLTTLQHYYVPLEMFAVHFASLPWLLFLAIKYLREGKRRILACFSVATVLSASLAHTFLRLFRSLSPLSFFGIYLVSKEDSSEKGSMAYRAYPSS
jgi:hypothetical protein